MSRWWLAAGVAVVIAIVAPRSASAYGRLIRRIDAQDGLSPQMVSALAQDRRGFVWIGTTAGLHRYDGRELRRWDDDDLVTGVTIIGAADSGTLYLVDHRERLHAFDPVAGEAEPVLYDGAPITDVRDLAVVGDTVWIARRGELLRREPDGAWTRPAPGVREVHRLRAGDDGALYAASATVIWRIDGETARQVGTAERIVDVLPWPDGSLRVLQFVGEVVEVRGDRRVVLFETHGGARRLARRGETLWVTSAWSVFAYGADRRVEELGAARGISSAGPLLVDREGVLWVGTTEGIAILPEPDTQVWTVLDGVRTGPIFAMRTDEGVWISSWTGLARIGPGARAGEDAGVAIDVDPVHNLTPLCPDGDGGFWTITAFEVLHRRDGAFERWPLARELHWSGRDCVVAPDGRAWVSTRESIAHVAPGVEPRWFASPVRGEEDGGALYLDRRDRLWTLAGDRACWIDSRVEGAGWTCARVAGAQGSGHFVETDAGTLWLAAFQGGVYRFDEAAGTWSMLRATADLPSRRLVSVRPSRRGGVWLIGAGFIWRVVERGDGWDVVEDLGLRHGLESVDGEDVLEDAGGDLWVVENSGVHHVPRAVRDAPLPTPTIVLDRVVVEGRARPAAPRLELPYRHGVVELVFAAPSFRDPTRLRYRMRLAPGAAWSAPITNPSFRFVDLSPGDYRIEVAASVDGRTWSAVSAAIALRVDRPWFQRWWAFALGALGLVGLGVGLQRLRTAVRLRIARQRQRIAIDLHDDMGSGLGSIGILAGLASDETLTDEDRRGVAARIADTAAELGDALGDIVGSLRERPTTLDALVAHVIERARRLFPAERGVLAPMLPDPVPSVPVTLAVRRNVQRIALEALHNAARHARASRVELALARAGRRWRLSICDDGVGIRAAAETRGGGVGLESMRERADEIGAELTITVADGGGTCVIVEFDPGARP